MIDALFAKQLSILAAVIEREFEGSLSDEEQEAIRAIIDQAPKGNSYRLSEQLASIIRMLMQYPRGLSILLGREAPPSTSKEINDMIVSFTPAPEPIGRVDGGQSIPLAERLIYTEETFRRVISECGGWKHIAGVVCGWMRMYPNNWAIIKDHVAWVEAASSRIDGSILDKLAKYHGCSTDTINRMVNKFPIELAEAILRSPIGDSFDLSDASEYKAV